MVSFIITVDETNTFTEGTFEFDESLSGGQNVDDTGWFGYECLAVSGSIHTDDNSTLFRSMKQGKITIKKSEEKHTLSFEIELEDGKMLSGSFTGGLTKSSMPVS